MMKNLILLLTLFLIGCSITLYDSGILKKNNWEVKDNKTKTGNLLKKRLAKLSDKNKDPFAIELTRENFVKRVVGVDEKGNPETYLQELKVYMLVYRGKKIFAEENVIIARQISQNENSAEVSLQQQQMIEILVNDILFRLSEIANQKDEVKRFNKALYKDLNSQEE